jgi:transcriptional regulator with XRE-family HTH domain
MVKADLRKAENADWIAIGNVLNRARALHGWSLKQFADAVGRDERQVSRWFLGTERPQFEAAYAVEPLRISLVIALAEQIADGVTVTTQISATRRAVNE